MHDWGEVSKSRAIWNQIVFYELLCTFAKGRRWLDVGCGRGTDDPALVRIRCRIEEKMYVGIDVDMESLRDCTEANRVYGTSKALPFRDGSFDLVTSNMVFEHLDDPLAALSEASRVLRKGGHLIIHTASSRHYMLLAGRVLSTILPEKTYTNIISRYTGRKKQDIFPTVYKANTLKKLSKLAAIAGFTDGILAHLETPLDFPVGMRSFEQCLRSLTPRSLKSTIVAIYPKRETTQI